MSYSFRDEKNIGVENGASWILEIFFGSCVAKNK